MEPLDSVRGRSWGRRGGVGEAGRKSWLRMGFFGAATFKRLGLRNSPRRSGL